MQAKNLNEKGAYKIVRPLGILWFLTDVETNFKQFLAVITGYELCSVLSGSRAVSAARKS